MFTEMLIFNFFLMLSLSEIVKLTEMEFTSFTSLFFIKLFIKFYFRKHCFCLLQPTNFKCGISTFTGYSGSFTRQEDFSVEHRAKVSSKNVIRFHDSNSEPNGRQAMCDSYLCRRSILRGAQLILSGQLNRMEVGGKAAFFLCLTSSRLELLTKLS